VLSELQSRFESKRIQPRISDTDARRVTRRLAQSVFTLVPQFIAIAQQTMLADDGWRFCELGLYLERGGWHGKRHLRGSAIHPTEGWDTPGIGY